MASLQGTSDTGLEKGQDRRDAEGTISGREKVVEMTYSLSPKTRMTGHHRKVTRAGSGYTKGDFPLGNTVMSLLEDAQEDSSLADPNWRLNKVTETKSPPRSLSATVCDDGCLQ